MYLKIRCDDKKRKFYKNLLGFFRTIFSKISFIKSSDKELVELYQNTANSKYFDELYRRHNSNVFGKCLSMLNDKTLSEDALQDIFLKVLLNISNFNLKSKFSTWLYSITYNHCVDLIRKEGKLILRDDDEVEVTGESILADDYSGTFLMNMKVKRLKVVLESIPEKDRAVLLMKYQGGLSIKELTKILGKSESAVKMAIKRAKDKSIRKYKELYDMA